MDEFSWDATDVHYIDQGRNVTEDKTFLLPVAGVHPEPVKKRNFRKKKDRMAPKRPLSA